MTASLSFLCTARLNLFIITKKKLMRRPVVPAVVSSSSSHRLERKRVMYRSYIRYFTSIGFFPVVIIEI